MNSRTQIIVPEWRKPVIAIPLNQAFPELGEVKEFRSKVCLFNSDRTKIFDVVSDRYQVIDHGQMVDRLSSALEEYFEKPVRCDVRSLNSGARVMAKFSLPIAPIKVGKNDISEITLQMRNSYDRSWVFSAVLGAFRLVCSNGMTVGEKFGVIKARHVGFDDSESLLEELDYLISRAPTLKETWLSWRDTRMTYEGAYELLNEQFPARYLDPILIEDRFPRSKWDLYNDLTRFSTHDTKTINRRVEFDDRISRLFYGSVDVEDAELVE